MAATPTPPPTLPPTPPAIRSCAHEAQPLQQPSPFPSHDPDQQMGRVIVDVLVSLDATGKVTAAKIVRSSGNYVMDQAAVKAAEESTYAPKFIALDGRRQSTGDGSAAPIDASRCIAVPGSYIYRVTFDPVG